MGHEGEYLTTDDVCERYHVTRRSVYRWRAQGLLAGRKIGRSVLYTPDEVERAGEALADRDRERRERAAREGR